MITEFWYNNESVDLYAETKIRHTFQVNDIAEVRDRQTTRTNSFNIPKTAKNVRIMGGLGISSDTSRLPYQKPNCRIKLEGFDLIVKGWANIKETDNEYKIYVYSGIISFFKAIENKTLGNDLDLSEIDHTKNLQSVISSFSNPNYRYFIADFNGKTHYGNNDSIVNIDYLIPAARVKYLWEKIHSKYNFTYSGSIFSDSEFDELFISYPKGFANDNLIEKFNEQSNIHIENTYAQGVHYNGSKFVIDIPIAQDQSYQVRIDFDIFDDWGNIPLPYQINIWFDVHKTNGTIENHKMGSNFGGQGFYTKILNLEQGDVVNVWFDANLQGNVRFHFNSTIKLFQINYNNISFSEELKDFSMSDFVKEILNRFGLTMFPDEFSNEIRYKTITERVNNAKKIDWSKKYIERTGETYVFENYAQQNNFQFNYNDKEGNYSDSSIAINNFNIADSKVAFKSKTYAPERLKTIFNLNSTESFESDVFKVHEKEVNEKDGVTTIKYKSLSKRFFFIFGIQDNKAIHIGSETLNESQIISSFLRARFAGNWNRILKKYYPQFSKILNDSRIHDIDLDLNPIDIITLDLDALYYFEQEQQYYLANKITADENRQSGEFVRVKPFEVETDIVDPVDPPIDITLIEWNDGTGTIDKSGSDATIDVKITSIQSTIIPNIISKDWQIWDGANFVTAGTDATPFTMSNSLIGANKIRLRIKLNNGNSVYSNELRYVRANYLPCIKYYVSRYAGSGDDLSIYWRDCNYEEQSYFIGGQGTGQLLGAEVCATEGTVSSNGTITEVGVCN